MSADDLDDNGEAARGVVQAEVTERSIRAALALHVRGWLPARVEKYNAAKNRADVKILVGDFQRDETGQLVTFSVPIVPGVAVAFLTAGGFTFTVPIKEGETTGGLFFAARSLDRWLSGQGQEVVDPELYHRHAMADAMFIPGLLPFGNPMSVAPPTDHATAGSIGGARIHFRDGTITVGDESGSKKIGLDGDAVKAKQALKTWAQQVETGISGAGGVPPAPVFSTFADLIAELVASATQAKAK
jgi:hypothetical protein